MCLSIRDIENSKDFSLFRKEKEKLVAWKVFTAYHNDVFLYSYYENEKAKQKYSSDRNSLYISPLEYEEEEIDFGIHVYLRKPKAFNPSDFDKKVIVKCYCDKKELVSVGYFERYDKPDSAVFGEVELLPPPGYHVNSRGFIVKVKNKNPK